MKKETKKNFCIVVILLAAFVIWTAAVRLVDVQAIGPQGSAVGFATINGWVHNLAGVHMSLYTVTDWLGLVPIGVAIGFALLGLMPLEDKLQYTRKALELIHRYGFGATLITKSDRVLRDLDLLKAINERTKCVVQMTLTTYDEELCRKLEPGVCTTKARIEALKTLRDAGIPTVVWMCPILPFINDTPENINGILDYCEEAQVKGIICFGMGVMLRAGNREYFYRQLDRHFPGLKAEYIRRYGNAYMLDSPPQP